MNWTSIQWTWAAGADGKLIPNSGSTWNPLLGCKEISPGCANCYSARLIGTRFSKNPKLPMYHDIATVGANGHPHFTGAHRMLPDRLDEPLRSRKGRKVFVCDMSDLFFEGNSNEEIAAVFGVMAACPQHTFQVLTKRAERMAEFMAWLGEDNAERLRQQGEALAARKGWRWPLPNVWIGVSVEDQRRADERIPHLLRVPAAARFLSVEPQLEAIDLTPWLGTACRMLPSADHSPRSCSNEAHYARGVDWVIAGGESGRAARPFELAWARSLRDQCRAARVAFFLKQFGANAYEDAFPSASGSMISIPRRRVHLLDSHGGSENEWPGDLLGCRSFPEVRP